LGAKRARGGGSPGDRRGQARSVGASQAGCGLGGAWAVLAAAIGPNMTVYTRHARALNADGGSASARAMLALMNTALGLQNLTAAELKDFPTLSACDAQAGRPS